MSTFKQNFLIPAAGHIPSTSLASTATSITTGGWTLADSCRSLVAICTVLRVIRPDGGPVELQPKVVLA